jgi:hypothetical protein
MVAEARGRRRRDEEGGLAGFALTQWEVTFVGARKFLGMVAYQYQNPGPWPVPRCFADDSILFDLVASDSIALDLIANA